VRAALGQRLLCADTVEKVREHAVIGLLGPIWHCCKKLSS
jgi:hypothetical protein